MKALLLFTGVFFWMCLGLAGEAEAAADVPTFDVMVVADRVNLRNAGSLDSDVVGQVNYGDMLTGLELEEEWVRIRPPQGMAVWVHGGLLFEDREVRARVLNMRSGPGTQFDVLGQLERMDPVTVVERYDEWRRIVPTDAVQVWIFRELLQVMDPPEAEEAEADAEADPVAEEASVEAAEEPADKDAEEVADAPMDEPAEEPAEDVQIPEAEEAADEAVVEAADEEEAEPLPLTEVETVPEVVPVVEEPVEAEEEIEAPDDVRLVPLEGQGTASVRRGWVKAYLIAGSAPSRFQLVFRERGREEALAYLRGDEEEIRSLVGRQVLVRGRDFWVAGQRVPLMRIESIEVEREPGQ
ncbi:MAG: SH3 domain-containing protein [Verrucomicrobia bacterium]|nr:SH3 domain-containing protein [Verrucomicrobiota bacterium]